MKVLTVRKRNNWHAICTLFHLIPTQNQIFYQSYLLCPLWLLKNLTFYWPNKSNKQLMKLLKVLSANKFSQAIDLYTKAIELNGQNAVYWANRAFSHTKLEEYGSAIQDASRAIDIDPKYSKGYSRRGAAYLSMGKFKDALKDFQK